MSKILYLFDAGDAASRMPVARAAKNAGFDVVIALIGSDKKIPDPDFKIRMIPAEESLNAATLLAMVNNIRKLISEEKPALIHTVTLKYAFITGLAALPFDVKKIYTLAGLGYLFHGDSAKAKILRGLTAPVLKFILRARGTTLIFQNPDDRDLMIKHGYADSSQSVLIRGSGVDLKTFKPRTDTGLQWEKPVVLMPTRLVREKGIHVFVEAAHILKNQGIDADFQIAGGITKHNPRALSGAEMDALTSDGAVKWLGKIGDMPGLLAKADLVVYPSYYGEGIPRVLLEACAAGCAIVTTDHPGCREAVVHNETGLLIPVKNPQATAAAIRVLLEDSEMRRGMGIAGRALAEKNFDINIIAAQTLKTYQQALSGRN